MALTEIRRLTRRVPDKGPYRVVRILSAPFSLHFSSVLSDGIFCGSYWLLPGFIFCLLHQFFSKYFALSGSMLSFTLRHLALVPLSGFVSFNKILF